MENTNKITNLLPTLIELNVMERYKDNILTTDLEVSDSFNDKFNFLVGQIIELEIYNGGTVPAIISKINDRDENGHNSYDIIFFIGNRNISIIEEKERYIWRFVPKKFNVKRIKKFIDEINNPQNKFNVFREELLNNYGINFLYSIENNKILTVEIDKNFEQPSLKILKEEIL